MLEFNDDGLYGDRIAIKRNETIDEFLLRVLPSDTTSEVAPWIQIHNQEASNEPLSNTVGQYLQEVFVVR